MFPRMMPNTITITLNGEPRDLPEGLSLLELLARFDLDPRAVVVELNREIVRRPALGETSVSAGDAVELVHFVGGG
jgi:thiamine biosynthesis protein ThiS